MPHLSIFVDLHRAVAVIVVGVVSVPLPRDLGAEEPATTERM